MEFMEKRRVSAYASSTDQKIYSSQADLDPKDHADPKMLIWCRQKTSVVVMVSGVILTSKPASRVVQNCKIIMQEKGLAIGQVLPATPQLIQILLDNATTDLAEEIDKTVSIQQQRLRMLVKEALDLGVTDIHMEIRQHNAVIRFRRHGELYLHAEWLPKLAREIASVAFNKETDHSVTHFNPLVPQNASMPLTIEERQVRLRLATLPAHAGFDLAMRILAIADEEVPNLDHLGYSNAQIELIKRAAKLPHGAVIFSGPTGSGKTTTLASLMQLIHASRKLYTIEDPVEKVVQTATQVPVNTDHYDRSFGSMARTVLRMDPDVIVLGEIRDEDTAEVMVRAAITGHLIFSTLHTNSATEIVTRLHDLGIPLNLLASPELLSCLVCQKLFPLLCSHCCVEFSTSSDYLLHKTKWDAVLNDPIDDIQMRGEGCVHCDHLGIVGRSVIAEVIWVDDAGRHFIRKQDIFGWQQYLKQRGWQSMREQLLAKIKQGECDPMAAEKMVGELCIAEQFNYADRDIGGVITC